MGFLLSRIRLRDSFAAPRILAGARFAVGDVGSKID
jgi:hypothetical protein